MNKIIFILGFLLVSAFSLKSQTIDTTGLNSKLEDYLESGEAMLEDDELKFLRNNPIKILTAGKDDLLKLPFIGLDLAEKILFAIKNGDIKDRRDLKAIIGDKYIYQSISPLISFKAETKLSITLISAISSEMQNRRGYDSVFEGSKTKSISRLSVASLPHNLTASVLVEKDPGEAKLTDHYSGYLKYESRKFKIILGDYRVSMSEGLTFGNYPFFFDRDNLTGLSGSARSGVRSYSGSGESNYLRGLCAEYDIKPLRISAFYSNQSIDATVNPDGFVTSRYDEGLHRYATEIKKKNALKEKIFGGSISYCAGAHYLSLNIYSAEYDKAFLGSGYYGLRGKSFSALGIGYSFSSEFLNFSAELTKSKNIFAGLINLEIPVTEAHQLFLGARIFPYDFVNPFSTHNGSMAQNEISFYSGIKLNLSQNVELKSFVEIFKKPYRIYYNPFPSKGLSGTVKLDMVITKDFSASARYRIKSGDEYITAENIPGGVSKIISEKVKNEYRLELLYSVVQNLYFRTRLEGSFLEYKSDNTTESGFMVYHDVLWQTEENLFLNCRLSLFNTNSYETAIYQYERDITGSFGSNALYDNGCRFYFTAGYKLQNIASLLFKYSNSTYKDKKSIGSSFDELKGRSISKVSFEMNITF